MSKIHITSTNNPFTYINQLIQHGENSADHIYLIRRQIADIFLRLCHVDLNADTRATTKVQLSKFGVTGAASSVEYDLIFNSMNAMKEYEKSNWCLLTTFCTVGKPYYTIEDPNYDALYRAGITAIAVQFPNNLVLEPFQAQSSNIFTKFVNGGSWYAKYHIPLSTLVAHGFIKFLFCGTIPAEEIADQTPFLTTLVHQDQIEEVKIEKERVQL